MKQMPSGHLVVATFYLTGAISCAILTHMVRDEEEEKKKLAYCMLAAAIFLVIMSAIGSGSGSKMPKSDKEIEMYLNNEWFEHQR